MTCNGVHGPCQQHQEWAATSQSVHGGGVTGHSLARMRERAVDLKPSPKAPTGVLLGLADATAPTNKTHAPGRKLRHPETEPCRPALPP